MEFQIGSDKCRFIYSPTQMEVNSAPVYKCRRGTREGSEDVFWLAREKDGRWIAREAHTDSTDPVRQGINFLQTMNPIDDITNPGDIDWMWFDTRTGTWEYCGHIMITHIQNGSEPSLHQNQIDVGASTITSAQVVGRTILSAPAIKFSLKMKRQWWQLVFGVLQLSRDKDLS